MRKNVEFFRNAHGNYEKNVGELDTYSNIRASVGEAIRGISRLLDIGNGGIFDYETGLVGSIVALDPLFDDFSSSGLPGNVTLRSGSALDIPEPDASFDGVLMVMLLHHLVGKTARESLANVRAAMREGLRVLRPGGRLVIVESCVPRWFYLTEKILFPVLAPCIHRLLSHPATLQFPPELIEQAIRDCDQDVVVSRIALGRWILQFGFRFPAVLTPVQVHRFMTTKV